MSRSGFYRHTSLMVIVNVFLMCHNIKAQAPCSTNFTGYDPCTAEFLSVGVDCSSAEEVFRTNTCAGISPASTGCGVTGGNIVWGRFVIITADVITITWTASNNRNLKLGLYQFTDACDADWDLDYGETEVACVNAGGNGVDETISQFLAVGTYYVAAKSSGNLTAASKICVHSPSATPPITASDCAIAVDVCTSLDFTIDPNGTGTTNEIPAIGSTGNPLDNNPGGSGNFGCLQENEKNSTWMVVNISGSGDLEFTFGGNGTQVGFYDWIMYTYDASSCADIIADTDAPVRCNWNGMSEGGTGLANVLPAGGDGTNFEPPLPVLVGEQYIICFSNYSDVSTSVPLEFGGTATVSCTPLPIDLLSFGAEVMERDFESKRKIKVDWSTVTEINNDVFTIEKSADGITFENIGKVNGAGNSEERIDYELIDHFPATGLSYYRLIQTDFDGVSKYFPMASVNLIEDDFISLYPNPSEGVLRLKGNFPNEAEIKMTITDLRGRNYFQEFLVKKGNNDVEIEAFQQLQKGYYFIKILDQNGALISISKVVKL